MAFGSRTVRGSSLSARTSKQQKKNEKKNKKHGNRRKCTRGIDCPFQHEHQHNLEFYHEGDGIANTEEGENKSTSSCSSFEAFSGNGNVVRKTSTTTSTSSSLDGRNVKESRRIVAEEAASRRIRDTQSSTTTRTHPDVITIDCGEDHEEEEQIDMGQNILMEGNSKEPIDLVSPVSTRRSSHASSHVVDLCDDDDEPAKPFFGGRKRRANQSDSSSGPVYKQRQRISDGFSEHEQAHPILSHHHDLEEEERRQLSKALALSNHDVIKEQDAEYYESLRRDQEKDQIKKDKQTMERIMEESIKSQELEEQKRMEYKKQDSLNQLDAEPSISDDGVVTIAFKLPRSLGRITRRFAPNAKSDQMHFFLIQRAELADVGEWRLCNVVGGKEIVLGGDQKTLEELGLAPRGLVIVREVDC
mmetsp:Transcript_36540/g.53614  ORF Transcript_36540/g.53614 Transcript_36540/m.53614 type:complete len:416 (-) Transcript_36540:278-1525(-)|eukprot:CAMPEP_0195510750 /NCGR_PEP_ID=MMETSP0794_2-20130614/3307_1 /TAXON_ID=515487 /ORGANISM="Stephanopyxis turris, Strain CCMP 815" /LENGTH=415 /DNA_ID=CAMNT_0040638233 /DNA_START=67 /DNA_END=1314 /DNA_ORIENTATION=-